MSEVKLNNNNFKEEVLNSEIPVLVDFWADWCGPCKMLSPVVKDLADELKGKVKVCTVNVDEEAELSIKFNVQSIPTLMVFKNGEQTNRSVGYCQREEILDLLDL